MIAPKRLASVLLACLLALPGAAAALTPTDVEQELVQVSALSAAGKPADALARLKTDIKANPGQIAYHLAYIELLQRVNQAEDAQRVYKAFLDQNPGAPWALFLYGKALTDPKAREAQFQAALQIDPRFPWAHLGMASVAVNRGELDRAIAELNAALTVAPTLEPALEMMGTILGARGELVAAIAVFERLAVEDTVSGRPEESLAKLYGAAGRPADAIKALETASARQPGDAQIQADLADLYFALSRYPEAHGAYARVLKLAPEDEQSRIMMDVCDRVASGDLPLAAVTLVQQARAAEETDPRAALDAYAKAVAAAPNFAVAQAGYGRLLMLSGDLKAAATALGKAISLDPDLYEARMADGRLLLDLGRPDEAERQARRAAELQPHLAEPHMLLGVVYTTLRDPRRAEIAYRNALPLLAGDAQLAAGINLAGAIAAQGRVEEAAAVLAPIHAAAPDNVDVTVSLASLYIEAERFKDARALADGLLRADPSQEKAKALLDEIDERKAQYDQDMATKQRVSQILVATQAEADAVLKELSGGADFAAVARARSKGPEAVDGGDLGFYLPSELAPELSRALAGVPVGGITGVVRTSAGYVVLKRTH